MEACSFPESNHSFSRPEDLTDEQCSPLSVWVGTVAIGDPTAEPVPAIISCWKLTADEVDHLTKGGRLWLTVIGNQLPPISVSSASPFSP